MGRGNLTVHSLRIVMLLVIGAFVCVGQTSPNSPTKFDLVLVGTVTQKGESSFREVPTRRTLSSRWKKCSISLNPWLSSQGIH